MVEMTKKEYINIQGMSYEDLKDSYENLLDEHVKLKEMYAKLNSDFTKAKERYKYFDARFVEVCKECDISQRAKCVAYPEYCDGTKCKELVDLMQLVDNSENLVH